MTCAGHAVVDWMAQHQSHLWFPQHLHQSAHLRRSLRSFQVDIQEDAEEKQQRGTRGNAGLMIESSHRPTVGL